MKSLFVHTLLPARQYQNRPEFRALLQWWLDGGPGVFALVGIGGAGKTAIAERFLRVLPGSPLVARGGPPQKGNLPQPDAVFVFSFYSVPNPDSFFGHVHAWVKGEIYDESERAPSYNQVIQELSRVDGRLLVVLDGSEKVQDDGTQGGRFGTFFDNRLRDLVLRVSDGYLSHVSLLITTRFQLYDPMANRSWYCRQIEVDRLGPEAAVALLRARGANGTDTELNALAQEQGYHALTVDLMGGYVAHFCDGAPRNFGKADEISSLSPTTGNVDHRVATVQEQERRLKRVADRYKEAFAESDPAALALLQRVCLFRLGATEDMLARIFLGEGKEEVAGPELSALSAGQLKTKLELLESMGLLELGKVTGNCTEPSIYTLHPAIREGFSLDSSVALVSHNAIRIALTSRLPDGIRWLAKGPGSGSLSEENYPSDPAILDLLEEIIYHTLEAGYAQEALEIYRYRMGRYANLGHRLADYERGERICLALIGGNPLETSSLSSDLCERRLSSVFNSLGMYSQGLGRLDLAIRCYERGHEIDVSEADHINSSISLQNLADVHLLAGRVQLGLAAAEQALWHAEIADSAEHRRTSYSYCAVSHALHGKVDEALAGFAKALHWQQEHDMPLWSYSGVLEAQLLAWLGRFDHAVFLTENNKEITFFLGPGDPNKARCDLVLADISRVRGDLNKARQYLITVYDWAIKRDARQFLCWEALIRARVERDEGDLHAAKSVLENGLRIARDCGFGIFHIDLLLVQASVCLLLGDPDEAEKALSSALFEGEHPSEKSGYPELLAATDFECGYAWGIAEGRWRLAETYLLQAATALATKTITPVRKAQLPEAVGALIAKAEEELSQAVELCHSLTPEDQAEPIPLMVNISLTREKLCRGDLTAYPFKTQQEASMRKTIVEADLVGYTPIARGLEEQLGPKAVKNFNDEIQALIDKGLKAIGVSRGDVVQSTAGDNAILVLESPEHAHHFAVAVHTATDTRNATRARESGKWWFRIGVATGEVVGEGKDVAGTVFVDAVRREAAGTRGHVLMDQESYNALPDRLKALYCGPETLYAKHGEVIEAYRLVVAQYTEPPKKVDAQAIYDMVGNLPDKPRLLQVALSLRIPEDARPSGNLPYADQLDQIVAWAARDQARLKQLRDLLLKMIDG